MTSSRSPPPNSRLTQHARRSALTDPRTGRIDPLQPGLSNYPVQSIIYAIAPALRSRINSVYMVCYFAGGALGSSLGSHIYTGHQWPGVCELGALIGAIAVVGALVDLLRSRGALYQKTADSSRSSASS